MFRIDRAFVHEGEGTVTIKPPVTIEAPPPLPEAQPDTPVPKPAEEPVMPREEAQRIARDILDEARREADELLEEASKQAQEVRKQGFDEGYQDGQKKAAKEGKKAREALASSVQETLDAIVSGRDDFLRSMEKDLLNLAVDIARKIVHTEIDNKDETFLMLVQNALNHMKSEDMIIIRLSAADYEWYAEAAQKFLHTSHSTAQIRVIEDPILHKGSVILESEGEAIGAGIETQLSSARIALMEEADIHE